VLAIVIPAFGVGMMGPGRMGMMWGYGTPGELPATGGWGWGLTMALGVLAMLASWGALLVGVALLVRWLARSVGGAGAGRPARTRRWRSCGGATPLASATRRPTSGCGGSSRHRPGSPPEPGRRALVRPGPRELQATGTARAAAVSE
jgi:hypothetical protein